MFTMNNMHEVLSAQENIDADEFHEEMLDYDSFINRNQHKIFVKTFMDHFRNAKKM